MLVEVLYVLVLGLIIGSFLNVCIYRIPLGRKEGPPTQEELLGEDVEEEVSEEEIPLFDGKPVQMSFPPRSLCPQCKEQLRWYHNIPVFSWIFLQGKCAFCKEKISIQYPFVELLSGLSALLAYLQYGLLSAFIVYVFACCLIVITFIDIKYYIIPDVITYPGMIIATLIAIANHYLHIFGEPVVSDIYLAFWGLILGGGFLLFISEVYFRLRNKIGLGFGDVKLMAFMGILFGPLCAYCTILIGSFAGSILGISFILISRDKMSRSLPFGPYLALGAYIYLFVPIDWQRLLGI